MTAPEFSRPVDVRQADRRQMRLEASEAERAALAARFALVRIDRLEAEVLLTREGREVAAEGRLMADIVQPCAVSGEDLAVAIDEPLAFRFVPARRDYKPDEEIELDAEDCDEIEYDGSHFDLGEAVAQSLALAIDPFLTGPDADAARERLRDAGDNPFAVLKGFGKS